MKLSIALSSVRMLIALCAGLTLSYPMAVRAADAPPQVSNDGLQLKVHTQQRLIYVRPGANFGKYDRVMILDCFVAMQKGWQQNYNSNEGAQLDRQVTDEDVQQIKSSVATQFKKVFTTELQKGGYQVTNKRAPDVLLLRPAIIDLVVTAPNIMSANMDVNVITSAGSGTLYLELWDPSTDTILARIMDAEADQQPFAQQANAVTNRVAADTILRNWADDLVRHLDAARGKPPSL
jgi:hypothetical protein